MSGRKVKATASLFRSCEHCNIRVLTTNFDTHVATDCFKILPYIQLNSLWAAVGKISQKSRILADLKAKGKSSEHHVFISHELVEELGLRAGEWVMVQGFSSPSKEIALQVWPISLADVKARGNQPQHKVFLCKEGFLLHPSVKLNCEMKIVVSMGEFENQNVYPVLDGITVDVYESPRRIKGNMKQEFLTGVQRVLQSRAISCGNIFRIRYFDGLLSFTVTEMNPASGGILKEYGEFTKITNIKVVDIPLIPDISKICHTVSLVDIGGLSPVVSGLCSSIKYMMDHDAYSMRSYLLFGPRGSGKSLVAHAVCNFFKLNVILCQKESKRCNPYPARTKCINLRQAFDEALLRPPAAIIIEDLDTWGTDGEDPDARDFCICLKNEFKRMDENQSKVVVIATTSRVSELDPDYHIWGIFGRDFEFPVPTAAGRREILSIMLRKMNSKLSSEDMDQIASKAHGFVGGDLRNLCNGSQMLAISTRRQERFGVEDMENCLKTVKPAAMKGFMLELPNVKWGDIGGQSQLKYSLAQAIEWPMNHSGAFNRMGILPPKGFLMFGPPGCSKTMIAKAVAAESGLNFISAKGSEIFSKWVGESEKAIQGIFQQAKDVSPAIVFFDEIDALGGERGLSAASGSSVQDRVLSQLLIEVDGIQPLGQVTIIAATNRPDIIDSALMRPGRLDRIIYVPLPDAAARLDIFRVKLRKMPVDPGLDRNMLVSLTEGYSGAEITAVCQEAGINALKRDIKARCIEQKHFLDALKTVTPRISQDQIRFYENFVSANQTKFAR